MEETGILKGIVKLSRQSYDDFQRLILRHMNEKEYTNEEMLVLLNHVSDKYKEQIEEENKNG